MKFVIESGTPADIDELEKLYDDLNDYLAATTNYPGWIKGIYPVRECAVDGIQNNTLYVVRYDEKIVGSIILDHQPEEAYNNARWKVNTDYSHIFVIRTFVVHPSFLKMGIGRALMDYSFELAQQSGVKSIRLDVYEKNLPAISLYEKCGFEYIDTVGLGLGNYGLDWFKLYEKVI
ncbi:GNAT family N-acetyltransferase [Parabacteroides faecis]|uniref:Ribosomal protein S18 acetylase RimI-like enzyme n=1 Tax=Parabacteroides faecis TaxID=1217282 RepID=A0ABR6KQF7_9BACT|nr:GNAT family N-acetyltransferase [Parabacteroides faecis]MBB4623665.1 ribosomal protein S18 acetylase RimI-like enzyme [Parabacteroides faecis]GGK01909.1 N-acetyltransferase [Parabacteroides faecis]